MCVCVCRCVCVFVCVCVRVCAFVYNFVSRRKGINPVGPNRI